VDGKKNVAAEQANTICFSSQAEANPWLAVDLGAALSVVGVLFTNRDCCGRVHLHYQVKLEMCGKPWRVACAA